ncbi:ankyrin repeat domain-containing protein [Candidatus Berkiella aquae]|uniref:Ankyrin repeat domain-containing protein n=1 Tax=Candidatus Berkiella aquae TaxID=295108 RepID=A0A0Q9YZR2_9GAMM|nr:ankyrin repeat domain-containing protein [Candidatus Berkiella aquae]MCS5710607.1 ankyrin repeat domain-containing protein [Candidatus Berkiella aquae]
MKTIDSEIEESLKNLNILLRKRQLQRKEILAAQKLHEEIQKLVKIKQFLDANGFIHINQVKEQNTPLIAAITQNNIEVVDLLLSHPKIKINQPNNLGRTPVWISAHQGKVEFLKKLSDRKADFRKADNGGKTPLFASMMNGFSRATAFIVHKLTGLSIYDDNEYGQLPVHALKNSAKTQEEFENIIKLFKENNIDIDAKNDNMQTALIAAANEDNLPLVKALIAQGADLTAVDRDNGTFLDALGKPNRSEILLFMKEKNMNTEWFENVDDVKRYGHILGIGTFLKLGHHLGLGGVIRVPIGKAHKTAPVYTEAWHRDQSFKTLMHEVKVYADNQTLPNDDFSRIEEALIISNHLITDQNTLNSYNDAYQSYVDGNPLILPVVTPSHGVGLALYKDKLIYTDRFLPTGGKVNECTKIFQLNNTSEAAIRDLITSLRNEVEGTTVTDKIRQYVDFEHPIIETGDRLQMHGTCTYSNPRSNIEGLLCVMQADRLNSNRDTIPIENIHSCRISAQQAYKDFNYKSRFRNVQSLMTKLSEAENQGEHDKANMYYDIVESYMKGHTSRFKNHGTDRANSLEMYQRLPPRLKKEFDRNNRFLARRLKGSTLYHRVHKVLKKNKKPLTNTILNEVLHQIKLQQATDQSPNLHQAVLETFKLIAESNPDLLKTLPQILNALKKDNALTVPDKKEILRHLHGESARAKSVVSTHRISKAPHEREKSSKQVAKKRTAQPLLFQELPPLPSLKGTVEEKPQWKSYKPKKS